MVSCNDNDECDMHTPTLIIVMCREAFYWASSAVTDELQQQKNTSGPSPVKHEQESEVIAECKWESEIWKRPGKVFPITIVV